MGDLGDKRYIHGGHLLDDFKEGDMVSWQAVGKQREYGIILKIFIGKKDYQKVAFAKVINHKKKVNDFLLAFLKREA